MTPTSNIFLVLGGSILWGCASQPPLYLRGKFDELAFDEEVLALHFDGKCPGGQAASGRSAGKG
jgi:hypothetical protein